MSQVGIIDNEDMLIYKAPLGSQSKMRFDSYTDEEFDSKEFFWNQLKVIAEKRCMDYFYHFSNAHDRYLDGKAHM